MPFIVLTEPPVAERMMVFNVLVGSTALT
jgi:hypothetical protein